MFMKHIKAFRIDTKTFPYVSEDWAVTGGGGSGGVGRTVHIAYPANLHQLSDHHNAEAIFLPYHPPEIIQSLLLGSCWKEKG